MISSLTQSQQKQHAICFTKLNFMWELCLALTVQHSGGSATVWDTISWKSLGPRIALDSRITANKYDQLYRIRSTTWGLMDSWIWSCLPWPPQWPDLNVIEPLRDVLELWDNGALNIHLIHCLKNKARFPWVNSPTFQHKHLRTCITAFQEGLKLFWR